MRAPVSGLPGSGDGSSSEDGRRSGLTAIEIVFVVAIVGMALGPILSMLTTGNRLAHVEEFEVLARRRAALVLAGLEPLPWHRLRDAAREAAGETVAGLGPGAQELPASMVPVSVVPGEQKPLTARVFVEDLEPGLGRLSAVVGWIHPIDRKLRAHVEHRLVGDPIHWRRQ